ncbi:MAG: Methyltransferase type 11 [uncultured bacterium]|nr:MAG: Methyltransferase type 11 [uncultured bacterium]
MSRSIHDRTQAFDGLAKNYNQARPTYPREMYDAIVEYWKAGNSSAVASKPPVIVDVGCGTGISTRALHAALNGNCDMMGIEPGKDMLTTAINASPENIQYKSGSAESIPVEDASVDIITAAQAAQWFKRPSFYNETQRALKRGGVVAIYENNRDWENSKFLEKHEEFLEAHSVDPKTQERYSRHYRDFPYEKELAENFEDAKTYTFFWNRKMTPEKFLEMTKTSTQVKRATKAIGEKEVDRYILENANQHVGDDNQVDVSYNTKLYMARKPTFGPHL